MDPHETTWLVTHLDRGEGELAPVISGSNLTFGHDGERVHGSAGCNRYMGPATIVDTVHIGPLATTMMYCADPEGVMEQEQRFLHLLSEADAVRMEEGLLELSKGGKVTIALIPLVDEP